MPDPWDLKVAEDQKDPQVLLDSLDHLDVLDLLVLLVILVNKVLPVKMVWLVQMELGVNLVCLDKLVHLVISVQLDKRETLVPMVHLVCLVLQV